MKLAQGFQDGFSGRVCGRGGNVKGLNQDGRVLGRSLAISRGKLEGVALTGSTLEGWERL